MPSSTLPLRPVCRQVVRHGFLRGFYHIGLGLGAAGGGRRMNPPVIQHLRDMQRCGVGVFRLHGVNQPQEQIMILCAVTLRRSPPMASNRLLRNTARWQM